jgi:hypothetical protein
VPALNPYTAGNPIGNAAAFYGRDDVLLIAVQEMGLVREDPDGQWTVAQGAFLWWLADEIRRNVRDETDFRTWLHAQEMEGVLTHQGRRQGNLTRRG